MLKKLIHLLISFSAFSICYLLAFLTEIPELQNVILYVFLIQWVLFIPAYIFKTETFYDLAGSSTYIFAVSYILYDSSENLTNLLLGIAIICWAVRLGSFLFFRINKAGEDKRFKELAERLICSNSPESASEDSLSRYSNFMNQRLYDKGPWLTLDKALEKIEKLLMDAEGEKKEILKSLEKNLNAKGV